MKFCCIKKLTATEKERYKQMAKTQPTRVVEFAAKFTSQGIPLEQVEREERERVEKEHYMQKKVKNIVENAFLDNGKLLILTKMSNLRRAMHIGTVQCMYIHDVVTKRTDKDNHFLT